MNLNDLAREISKIEGKKIQINIAQIKEVMKVTFTLLGKETNEEIVRTVNRYRSKNKRVYL